MELVLNVPLHRKNRPQCLKGRLMPYLYETAGPIIRRFVWWKLQFETGRWLSFTASDGRSYGTIWEREKSRSGSGTGPF